MRESPRILIACGSAANREIVSQVLAGRYRIETAENTGLALETILTHAPDLVVCDAATSVPLAGMHAAPPVITLSSRDADQGQVVQPFDAVEFLAMVEAHLHPPRTNGAEPQAAQDGWAKILDCMEDGVVGLNCDWHIVYVNVAAEQLFGCLRGDVLGKNYWDTFPGIAGPAGTDAYFRAIRDRVAVDSHLVFGAARRLLAVRVHPSDGGGVTAIFRDISPHDGLHSLQETLAAIVESSDDAIISKDLNGIVQTWNSAAERIFGYSAEEMIGQPIARLAAPGIGDEMPSILARIRRGERVDHFETHRRARDGTILTVSLTVSPVRDATGAVVGASKVVRDITQQERAEALLNENRQRLRAIFDSTHEYIGLLAPDGVVLEANRASLEFAGSKPEDVLGRPFHQTPWFVNTTGAREMVKEGIARAAAGEIVRFEATLQRPSGDPAIVDMSLHPVIDDKGKVILIVPEGRDITERKRAAEALCESEDRLRQALDSMPQLVWSTGPDGRRDFFNRQWFEYTGFSPEDSRSRSFDLVFHPDDRSSVRERWENSLAKGVAFEAEYRCRRSDGEYRWFLGRATPIRDEQGNTIRWLATSTDIETGKRVEGELRRAIEDLERFAYSANHDLQEPARIFSIYSQMLEDRCKDRLDPEGLELIGFMKAAAASMHEILRDLRAYSLRAGVSSKGAVETVDANAELKSAIADLAQSIGECGARVIAEPLPSVPLIAGDLRELFRNLIGYAIRSRGDHAPEIRIAAGKRGHRWAFSVGDNGVGIKSRSREDVFELFKRLHAGHTDTGIGLAICRRIVERYGGHIEIESEPGEGSIFRFTLPE